MKSLHLKCLVLLLTFTFCKKNIEIQRGVSNIIHVKDVDSCNYNLLSYTEDFSDQTWQRNKAVVIENVIESPLERKSADLLDLSKDGDQARIAQLIPNLENGTYAFSIYLKALPGNNGNHGIAIYAKDEKGGFISHTVEVNDSEWKRAVVMVVKESFGDIIIYPGNKLLEGSQLDKIFIWGAQLEKLDIDDKKNIKPYRGKNIIE